MKDVVKTQWNALDDRAVAVARALAADSVQRWVMATQVLQCRLPLLHILFFNAFYATILLEQIG